MSWSVLAGRGWCFHERLLAPRVLHCGRDQILWECLETQACETNPKEIPSWFHRFNFKSLLSNEFGWQMIIESYMGACLTKHEDKLIALSGIAQRMQQVLDDEYLAGLWRRDLLSDLQWYVPECKQANGLPSTIPKPYRAPSWSWAYVEADVRYRSVESDILVKVIDASVSPVTEDPTGQVENGFIRLKGSLTAVELCTAQHYEQHRNLKVTASHHLP